MLVDRESAIQRGSRFPEDIVQIDRNHSEIVKFSEDDTQYSVIATFIRGVMDDTSTSFESAASAQMHLLEQTIDFPEAQRVAISKKGPQSHLAGNTMAD